MVAAAAAAAAAVVVAVAVVVTLAMGPTRGRWCGFGTMVYDGAMARCSPVAVAIVFAMPLRRPGLRDGRSWRSRLSSALCGEGVGGGGGGK